MENGDGIILLDLCVLALLQCVLDSHLLLGSAPPMWVRKGGSVVYTTNVVAKPLGTLTDPTLAEHRSSTNTCHLLFAFFH
eukprot:c6043_g1_i1 orf=282-521(+)